MVNVPMNKVEEEKDTTITLDFEVILHFTSQLYAHNLVWNLQGQMCLGFGITGFKKAIGEDNM